MTNERYKGKFPGTQLDNRLANDACRVHHAYAQSVPNGEWTILSWDTNDIDNNAMHNTTTNDHLITIKTTGIYVLSASLKYAINATGNRGLYISSNAIGVLAATQVTAVSGAPTTVSATCIEQLTAGDVIWMVAYQNSGAALSTTYVGREHSFLSIIKVG